MWTWDDFLVIYVPVLVAIVTADFLGLGISTLFGMIQRRREERKALEEWKGDDLR